MAKFSVCRIYKVTLWLNFSYNYSVNLLQILHLYIHTPFSVVLMSSKANFHVVRSALQNYSVYIFAGQVFYRSYVLRHIRLRSIFAWFCPCFQGWFCPSYIFFVRHQRDTWTLALSGTRNMAWFSECLSSMLEL